MTIHTYPQPNPASITSATYKTQPSDFQVTENLGFELSGEGEHLCLYVEKTGANTNFIAKQLANWANIPVRDVSFCGLKDRFAVTRQWFSLRIPKKVMPDTPFTHPEAQVLKHHWHSKKLARGVHQSNQFIVILREVLGEKGQIEQALTQIRKNGVPNYFGVQRFGHEGKNIDKIRAIFSGELSKKKVKRNEYSILLSSARAYLFNQIVATRVKECTWNHAVEGDVYNLDGTGSIFTAEIDEEIRQRVSDMDIHPTAAMWGRGSLRSTADVELLEQGVANEHDVLKTGLENAGLKQERRATRLPVKELSWQWQDDMNILSLSFTLGKGEYASTVLDSLVANLASGEPYRSR